MNIDGQTSTVTQTGLIQYGVVEFVLQCGTAGGESVRVTLNGGKDLVAISISKDAMDPEDPGMLEDLILAAFKDAAAKADEAMAKASGGMGGGLNIPGLKM